MSEDVVQDPVMEKRWIRKANREEVVQAALMVERWCMDHIDAHGKCDCPFIKNIGDAAFCFVEVPNRWDLEYRLRTRGLDHNG